ncbi:hypothetical protein G7046_g7569 [Stylonectria norvegica]|nr:hypothetical protein G7046_g7569 [Stylonectria norvegica]
MKVSTTYAAIAALSATANAWELSIPEATGTVVLPLNGFTPKPTGIPAGIHELFRRASTTSSDETVLVAPDNTCGYISGRPGAGYTCFGSATCVFYTSRADRHGAVACCNTEVCNYRLSCIDYNDFYTSSKCDGGCEVDIYTLKCTETSASFCNTIAFQGGINDYWCNSVNISTAQSATTTYRGGDAREFTPLALTGTDSTDLTIVTSGSSTVPGPSATVTETSASATSTSDNNGGGSKKSNTGPIVGGVVGGVGGLALIGAAVFLFLRNKKKKDTTAAAAANTNAPPNYQQPPPMQQQPGTGPGGYNPVPQGQQTSYYDPKTNPYPSPNQQTTSIPTIPPRPPSRI